MKSNEPASPLIRAAEEGTLARKLKAYLKSCRQPSDGDVKKREERLPNFAGFCASLKCGTRALEHLRRTYPEIFDYLAAVLEDEALNSSRSPAIVNAYIKDKFGTWERGEDEDRVQLIFEHDILEDGV